MRQAGWNPYATIPKAHHKSSSRPWSGSRSSCAWRRCWIGPARGTRPCPRSCGNRGSGPLSGRSPRRARCRRPQALATPEPAGCVGRRPLSGCRRRAEWIQAARDAAANCIEDIFFAGSQVFALGRQRRGPVPCRSIQSVACSAGPVVNGAALVNDVRWKSAGKRD